MIYEFFDGFLGGRSVVGEEGWVGEEVVGGYEI